MSIGAVLGGAVDLARLGPGRPDDGAGGSRRHVRDRASLLVQPLLAIPLGLALAGVLVVTRELALWTMPYESTQTLRTAEIRGAVAGSLLVVALVAAVTHGWRLRALAWAARGWPDDASPGPGVGRRRGGALGGFVVVLGLTVVQAALIAWATWHGHGTLAVMTSILAGQLALMWAFGRSGRSGAVPCVRVPAVQVAAVTMACMVLALAVLARDDDPRRMVAPYALAVPTLALAAGWLATRFRRVRDGPAAVGVGVPAEVATLVALVVVAMAPP